MHDLTVIKTNGVAYIDSREVAEFIGKRHDNLLRDIAGYVRILEKTTALNFEVSDFFLKSSYLDRTGRELPCYLLSKMACELVANKLIGEKGVLFTVAYVAKFNAMESAERAEAEASAAKKSPRLGEYNACVRIIVPALKECGATSERIVGFLKGVYEPLGISVAEDCELTDVPQTYTAKQIAAMFGVYSLTGNPHYQAISCILNENLFIGEEHKTVLTSDYGNHIGVSVRYDEEAAEAVGVWLAENCYPNEIYGFERTYNVLYGYKLSE